MVPNASLSLMWNERGNIPWAVEQYRDDVHRSDVIRVFTHVVPKVLSAQHGYRYADLVA